MPQRVPQLLQEQRVPQPEQERLLQRVPQREQERVPQGEPERAHQRPVGPESQREGPHGAGILLLLPLVVLLPVCPRRRTQ